MSATKKTISEEELRQSVPPEVVIQELNEFSEASGVAFEKIKDMYYDILVQPYLNGHEIEYRCMQASKIVMAQLLDKMSYQTTKMEIQIICCSDIKDIEKTVVEENLETGERCKTIKEMKLGKVFCIASGADEGTELVPKIGVITFWNDNCEKMENLEEGGTYEVEVGITPYETYYDMSGTDSTEFIPKPLEIPPPSVLIQKLYQPIPLSEAQFHLSEGDWDLKLVHARIRAGRMSIVKSGKYMGFCNVFDDGVSLGDYKSGQMHEGTIMFSDTPSMATKYLKGSSCYFLTTIYEDSEYGLSFWGQLVIPDVAIPAASAKKPAPKKPAPKSIEDGTQEKAIERANEILKAMDQENLLEEDENEKPVNIPDPKGNSRW